MRIGINCFKDIELRSIIESEGRIANCDITGEKNVLVYDTSLDTSLVNEITEVLNIYTPVSELPGDFPKKNLNEIEKIIVKNWSLFYTPENETKTIIMEICKDIFPDDALIFNEQVGMEKLCDTEFLKRNSLVKESTWESFMSSIKNINRFHSRHINLELLEQLLNSTRIQLAIKKDGEVFYRARICDDRGLRKEEMGPPLAKKVTAGRVNSAGISCLYLANDMTTTLHEIRARDLDYVSIATFFSNKDMRIINLSNLDTISPFSAGSFDLEWFAINMTILKKISNEIAKPLRRQDSELDYLPAQYISDLIKGLGYDGICYRSTLSKKGVNYAFFDHKKFKCTKIQLYYINSLVYETDPLI